MSFVYNLIPNCAKDLYVKGNNIFDQATNTDKNAAEFFHLVGHVVVAAAICFAAYKGSIIAAGFLATLSLPGALIAGGAMLFKYGVVTLKAGLLANQITQTVVGALALYSGWRLLNDYKAYKGALELLVEKSTIVHAAFDKITTRLGCTRAST